MTISINLPEGFEISENEILIALAIGLYRSSKLTFEQAAQLARYSYQDFYNKLEIDKMFKLTETEHLLSTNANKKHLDQSIAQVNAGNVIPFKEL
ncbi:UPF0175 family protein [Mucilaginibacter ginkgonis]|uniref:UPF0175 family protein n=1 Tax=Mucilaginibacter ginkgonis TaxID=2682091 RepID=A0A6I4IMZ8_9SPHI|nr:UPF0175 family protein [Mucilaginibacter ginkgonis]QQL49820.1 UPF0175 family protein [Mucilaginibacter ginkgonis]